MESETNNKPVFRPGELKTIYPVFNYWVVEKRTVYLVVSYSLAMYFFLKFRNSPMLCLFLIFMVIIAWFLLRIATTTDRDNTDIDETLYEIKEMQSRLYEDWISRNVLGPIYRCKSAQIAFSVFRVVFFISVLGGLVVSCLGL